MVFGVAISLALGLYCTQGKVIAFTSYLDKKRLSLTGANHSDQHLGVNFVSVIAEMLNQLQRRL